MKKTYSLYEAKAHLSAIVRQVREGQSVFVTVRGEPAVEIRPVEKRAQSPEDRQDAHIAELRRRGALSEPVDRNARIRPGPRVPGALKRFLEDRNA